MRVQGIGIGIVEIARLQRVFVRRPSSLLRWFSEEELARATGRARPGEDLAGRYACKLAVRSALQARLPRGATLRLKEITISNNSLGQPQAALSDIAAQMAGLPHGELLQVSITHSRQWAAAVALFCAEEESLDAE